MAPFFWKHFHPQYLSEDAESLANRFQPAVNELFVSIAALQPMVSKMDLLANQCNYKINQKFLKNKNNWRRERKTPHSQVKIVPMSSNLLNPPNDQKI